MGYNLSRFSFNRNKPQLDQLLTAECDIRFETEDPRKLFSKLREALLSSKKFEDLKHYYDTINPKFTFRQEKNAIIAEYASIPIGVPVGENDIQDNNKVLERNNLRGEIESARTLLDVIGGGVEGDKEGYEEIYFPNSVLNPEDQGALWDWTQTTEWEFIDHQEKGLTLTKRQGFEDIVWRPEEGE